MKSRKIWMSFIFVLVASALMVSMAAADDGVMFRKNISKTPEAETERAEYQPYGLLCACAEFGWYCVDCGY